MKKEEFPQAVFDKMMLMEYNYYSGDNVKLAEDDEDISDEGDDVDTSSEDGDDELDLSDDEIQDVDISGGDDEMMSDDMDMGGMEEEGEQIEVSDIIQRQDLMKVAIDDISTKIDALTSNIHANFVNLDQNLNMDIKEIENHIDKRVVDVKREIVLRNPTPNEKIAMQAPKSFPYNIRLSDFWEKEEESVYGMEDAKKSIDEIGEKQEEYIITNDDVENYNSTDIKKSLFK